MLVMTVDSNTFKQDNYNTVGGDEGGQRGTLWHCFPRAQL